MLSTASWCFLLAVVEQQASAKGRASERNAKYHRFISSGSSSEGG